MPGGSAEMQTKDAFDQAWPQSVEYDAKPHTFVWVSLSPTAIRQPLAPQ